MKVFKSIVIGIIIFVGVGFQNVYGREVIVPFHHNYALTTTYITSITQDPMGRMWIATKNQLYCFDGYSTKEYKLPVNKRITSISEIQCIHADGKNRVWIGLSIGLCCFDMSSESFVYYFPEPDDMLNMSNIIFDVQENKEGVLYFGTRNGIFYFDEKAMSLKLYDGFPWHEVCSGYMKDERIVTCLHFDNKGVLWAGTSGDGVSRLNMQDKTRIHFKRNEEDSTTIICNDIKDIYEDQFGVLWIGTEKGVSRFNSETLTFTNIPLKEVTYICEDSECNLIVGLKNGIAKIDRRKGVVKSVVSTQLPSSQITVAERDNSGGIWIGTAKGLCRMYTDYDFKVFRHLKSDSSSLAGNVISFLCPDSYLNKLWIGYPEGQVDLFDPVDGSFKHYKAVYPGAVNSRIVGSYFDRDSNFFVCTLAGVLKYNRQRDVFEPFHFPFSSMSLEETYVVYQDREYNYWLGILDKGLYKADMKAKTFEKIAISYEQIHQNIYTNIKIVHEDKDGYIWIVFWRAGILRYDPQTKEELLFTQESTEGLLPNNTVRDLIEVEDGIYLATVGGLAFWSFEKQAFENRKVFSYLDGVSLVGSLKNDNEKYLWFSTDDGIIRFNPENGNIIHFSIEDGLQGKNFRPWARAQMDSLFFFGGDDGLNVINTKKPFNNSYIPSVSITGISMNGRSVDVEKEKEEDIVYLKLWEGEDLEVAFSSFSYQKEWRNSYKLKLVGADTVIERLSTQHMAKFNGLGEGVYRFYLSASNSDGVWSDEKPVMEFKVRNRTKLIISHVLLFLFCTVVVWGVGYYVVRVIKANAKKRRLERLMEERKKRNGLQEDYEISLVEKFSRLVEKDELYRNKGLKKSQIADALNVSEHQLASVLKNHYGKSFPEIINGFRVEAVKKSIEDRIDKDYTLLAIGEDCGFNSKSSFYRIFKEFTGLTPSEYSEKYHYTN